MRRRQLVQLAAASIAAPSFSAFAQGAAFPAKPIKLIIAFPAGAGGSLPAQQLQISQPDGYTLAQIPLGVFRLPYTTKLTWDPIKDISYVINVTGYAFGIVAPTDGPIKNWADFVAYARANPGKLSYGSTGVLTSPHLTTELIAQKLGRQLNHIPYKGSAELNQALLGGHVMAGASCTTRSRKRWKTRATSRRSIATTCCRCT